MKSGIFISAGLGNALLLLPLLRALQRRGDQVTGIFTSSFNCEELFGQHQVFDDMLIAKSDTDKVKLGLKHASSFDEIYLDFFAATTKNMLLAQSIANKIISPKIPEKLPKAFQGKIELREPTLHIHESLQNLKLYDQSAEASTIKHEDFLLSDSVKNNGQTVAVQISAGNAKAPHKNWKSENWQLLLKTLSDRFEELEFVLLGDRFEIELAQDMVPTDSKNITSLVGQTSIAEVVEIIENCCFYLGLDGGLMHLAASFSKPTFTIWGGSDHRMYSYENIDPQRHLIIHQSPACWPCNSWLAPNRSRVVNPEQCPDFKCIREISVESVFEKLIPFLKHHTS